MKFLIGKWFGVGLFDMADEPCAVLGCEIAMCPAIPVHVTHSMEIDVDHLGKFTGYAWDVYGEAEINGTLKVVNGVLQLEMMKTYRKRQQASIKHTLECSLSVQDYFLLRGKYELQREGGPSNLSEILLRRPRPDHLFYRGPVVLATKP